MPDPEPDTGQTVELASADVRSALAGGREPNLPAHPDELRERLPGLEPERHVTDWGRSERVEGLLDRTVYEFLFHYWFRVEVEGIENVPREGGALLVANHAGALPPDGPMIAKAVKERHPRPRPVHLVTQTRFNHAPGLGMLLTKLGAVPAHPANIQRLLFDERQLVLAFPEGSSGARKPIRERYRLRPFAADPAIESALRARAPIVPLAVLGAEEAAPALAALRAPLGRILRLPRVPIAPALPLPAKFRIRFLEPVQTDRRGSAPWRDRGLVQALTHDLRALIQENLLELVAARRSVWLG